MRNVPESVSVKSVKACALTIIGAGPAMGVLQSELVQQIDKIKRNWRNACNGSSSSFMARPFRGQFGPLKAQPCCQLCGAAGASARNHAKVGIAERRSRNIENRVVEQIVEFAAQIELPALRNSEALL